MGFPKLSCWLCCRAQRLYDRLESISNSEKSIFRYPGTSSVSWRHDFTRENSFPTSRFFILNSAPLSYFGIVSLFQTAFFLLRRQSHRQERQSHPGDRRQVRCGSGPDRGRQRQKTSPGGGRQAGGRRGRHCQQQRGEWTVRPVSHSPISPTQLL